jgi:superfamily II DNA/RNA helicase
LAGTQAGEIGSLNSESSGTGSEARFEDLGLSPEVLRAIADSGYTTPTPIQAKGIPEVLKGRDMIGIAQTGTGKTASFTLPMIELLARGRAKARMPRSLILEPTRELAAQVAESFERYGKHHKLSMALLIGGVSFDEQDKKLDRGVDVLIATPGRLLDHFERGKLMLSQVKILVVDEADRMLDMGFIPDVERIAKLIPFTRQTLFYSATMPPEIQRLTEQFLQAPVRVEVSKPASTAANITQIMVSVPGGDWSKREALRRLIREKNVKNAIVFCNRKRDVDVVAKSLQKHGFNAQALHGDLDQSIRTRTLDGFRNNEIQLLVASDVAARGLDIPAVSHIFNFDVPFHADDYVHRIGRTGRAGRSGEAVTLVGRGDEKNVGAIERLIGQNVERIVMEGLPPETEQHRERGGRGDRGRGKDRERGRDRNRGRDRGPHHQESASFEPVSRNETPAPEARQPAPPPPPAPRPRVEMQAQREPQRQQREPQRQQREPQRHQPKPQAEAPRPREAQAQPQQPKGAIDHSLLPAFLLRPVNLPPKPEKKPARSVKDDAQPESVD